MDDEVEGEAWLAQLQGSAMDHSQVVRDALAIDWSKRTPEPGDYQPYYVAYATAHSLPPAEMARREDAAYPDRKTSRFMSWMHERWLEWEGIPGNQGLAGEGKTASFRAWLPDRVAELAVSQDRGRTVDRAGASRGSPS